MYSGDEQSQTDLRLIRVWMKASKSIYELILQDITRHELSVENFRVLEFLYNKGPHTIQKISKQLSIASGSITHVVNKLEKRGCVKREKSPTDRRSSIVVLTEKGQDLFQNIFPEHVKALSEIVSSLDNEEKVQLTDLLKKLGIGADRMK